MFFCHDKVFKFDNQSLFIFSDKVKIRKALVWLVEWSWFKNFILLSILLNSLLMSVESFEGRIDPEYEKTTFELFLDTAYKVFAVIFIVEFVAKVIA